MIRRVLCPGSPPADSVAVLGILRLKIDPPAVDRRRWIGRTHCKYGVFRSARSWKLRCSAGKVFWRKGLSNVNILIVDDSKAMRMIIRRTLRQAGYEAFTVVEACNGSEALDLVRREPPDLILCDWNMPEMSGLEFVESLSREGVQARFGFLTSESSADVRATAVKAGAAFFITKPFTPDAFCNALDPLMNP